MREIYKKAAEVVVWLGYDGDAAESKRAIETIKAVCKPPISREPGQRPREYPKISSEEVLRNWKAIEHLFKMPWWDRCWVRQEVALNRNISICYGTGTTNFNELDDVYEAVRYVDTIGYLKKIDGGRVKTSFYSKAVSLQKLRAGSKDGTRFSELSALLRHTRSCKATEHKDKVYSVLGLVDSEQYHVTVDYRLSVQEVFRNTMQSIWEAEDMNTFTFCQNPNRRHNLPSWVPNLQDDWVRNPFPVTNDYGYLHGSQTPNWKGDALIVQGMHLETVDQICAVTIPEDPTLEQLEAVFNEWQAFVDEAVEEFGQETMRWSDLWLTSTSESKTEGWLKFLSMEEERWEDIDFSSPDAKQELEYHYRSLDQGLIRAYLVDPTFDLDPQLNAKRKELFYYYGYRRRLGLSKGGHIGLFPDDVQRGDSITAITGARYMCILRRQKGDDFVLIDEAWIPDTHKFEQEDGRRVDSDSPTVEIRIV
jgi:hypothetical protein